MYQVMFFSMYEILSTQRKTLIHDFYQRKIVTRALENHVKAEEAFTRHLFTTSLACCL